MSVAILSNENGAGFYCTTTDWMFGPLMPGENVAEAFLAYMGRGIRNYTDAELSRHWYEFNETKMVCPNGHREADPTAYGDETIFMCWEKGCKTTWTLSGDPVEDETEAA